MTPPGHWNLIAQNVAKKKRMPLADADIVAWDAKFTYSFWWPVTAIHSAEIDGNPATEPECDWKQLLTTPSFPEYVSAHSTFSASAAAVMQGFFGTDRVHFEVMSDSMPNVVRSYDSFAQAAEEIGRSRIYGGIHFPSADKNGRKAGRALGKYVVDHFLLPRTKNVLESAPSSPGIIARQPVLQDQLANSVPASPMSQQH